MHQPTAPRPRVAALGFLAALAVAAVVHAQPAPAPWRPAKPNVVLILCDDLGIGDVHAMNPTRGKIATPNMDRLATQGMAFSDAHASSALCTPSRYTLLTGRYNWRSKLQTGVLGGDGLPLLEPGRMTLASLLAARGYSTACFGKWHLGLRYDADKYKGRIVDGPLQHGFDHFFGIAASLDMPPFAFIDDDHMPQLPTARKTWGGTGPAAPDFEAVDVVPALVTHATDYVRKQAAAADRKPFFLYLPLTSPHTPLVPTPQWAGKSSLGPYGDFVMETDWAVGQVLASLDAAGVAGQTLVVFTSDNGCSPFVGVKKLEAQGHYPSGPYRGYKSDIWEGGHREPLFVRWPGTVAAGSTTDQTVCLGDLFATLAQVTGEPPPPTAGEDSFSLLPILLGTQHGPLRSAEVNHSMNGNFALRQGRWKLELCAGSGGWAAPEKQARRQGLPTAQLYDLEADVGEQHNVAADHPDVVEQMTALLKKFVADGRTTPGPAEANDVPVDIYKVPKPATRPAEGND